jgi:integrase
MDVNTALVKFMKEYGYTLSKNTRASYNSLIQVHIIPCLGLRQVESITKQDIINLHISMARNPYQANRCLALISKLYNHLGLRNPAKGIKRYHERTRETYLTPPQIAKVFEYLGNHSSRPFVTTVILLLLTGARKREILNAKWADVDFSGKRLLVPTSKTGKKYVVLNEAAMGILEEVYSAANTYIVEGETPDKPRNTISKQWLKMRKDLGLGRVRVHDLRHTFASIIANTSANIFTLKDLLHHASVVTTQRYAHLFDETLREASNSAGNNLLEAGLELIIRPKSKED